MLAFLFLALTLAHADDLEARLQGYVTEFNLKPLRDVPRERLELRRLGQMLFMDRMLSGNKNIACLDCHDPRLIPGARVLRALNFPRAKRAGASRPRATSSRATRRPSSTSACSTAFS